MIIIDEPFFDIIVNAGGGVMLVIAARPGPAEKPFLVFDRFRTMALFRDGAEVLRLIKIPRGARRAIAGARAIDVAEFDGNGRPARGYKARVILDRALKGKLRKEAARLY